MDRKYEEETDELTERERQRLKGGKTNETKVKLMGQSKRWENRQ